MTDQEINEAVARKLGYPIMSNGSRDAVICTDFDKGVPLRYIPDYCHDIKAAWEIVEHIRSRPRFEQLSFCVALAIQAPLLPGDAERDKLMWFLMESIPSMAICKAFLELNDFPRPPRVKTG